MSDHIEFGLNKATESQIHEHLYCCDTYFVPPLSGRIEIKDYARKISIKATRFETWSNGKLTGLVACYCNDQETLIAHITNVSVIKACMGKGIATKLMEKCIEHAKILGMRKISLEVSPANSSAIRLYEKNGFIAGQISAPFVTMNLYLKNAKT